MNLRNMVIVLGFAVLGASPACAWHPQPERICDGIFDGYSSAAAAQAAASLQTSACSGIVRIEGELSAVSDSEIILRNEAGQQMVLKVAPEAGIFINGYPGLMQAACPVEDAPFYAVCLADLQYGLVYFVDAVFLGMECDLLQISSMEPGEPGEPEEPEEPAGADQWPADTQLTLKFDNGQTYQLPLWQACIINADLIPARVFILCTPSGQIRRIWF